VHLRAAPELASINLTLPPSRLVSRSARDQQEGAAGCTCDVDQFWSVPASAGRSAISRRQSR
jgi:hypothetical protein